tara:strand:- start:2064 stop:2561 length:498 start_codon:yes stop_codon:yes gene_type:complete
MRFNFYLKISICIIEMPYDLVNDLIVGRKNEKVVLSYLNKHIFNEDMFRLYKNERKQVDFRNNSIVGELKSRTNKHDTYQETFFGYNKLEYLIQSKDERDWKFYFLFTDGLYVWDYNKDEYRVEDHYNQDRGIVDQVYVNINNLKKITDEINFYSCLPDDFADYI